MFWVAGPTSWFTFPEEKHPITFPEASYFGWLRVGQENVGAAVAAAAWFQTFEGRERK